MTYRQLKKWLGYWSATSATMHRHIIVIAPLACQLAAAIQRQGIR